MVKIFLPKNFKFIVLNNNYIYIYNTTYFFIIKINSNFYYNQFLSILCINSLKLFYNFKNKNTINNFLFLWDNFVFNKNYFEGKGFKIKKIDNNLFFNFNHSHLKLLISQKSILKKIQKHKILFFTKNINYLKKLKFSITEIKKISCYTKRGIRNSKQIVFFKKVKSSN